MPTQAIVSGLTTSNTSLPQFGNVTPGSFLPSSLFGAGEAGGWWNFRDLSAMWKNTGGTTAATLGAQIARCDDKSGNGNNMVTGTSPNPFIYTYKGRSFARFDANGGFGRNLAVTVAMPAIFTRVSLVRVAVQPTGLTYVFAGDSNTYGGLWLAGSASAPRQLRSYNGVNGTWLGTKEVWGPVIGGDFGVICEEFNGAASTLALNAFGTVTDNNGSGTPAKLCCGGGGPGTVDIMEVVTIGRLLSSTEKTNLLAYMKAMANIS